MSKIVSLYTVISVENRIHTSVKYIGVKLAADNTWKVRSRSSVKEKGTLGVYSLFEADKEFLLLLPPWSSHLDISSITINIFFSRLL